jgi:hypothetical protein
MREERVLHVDVPDAAVAANMMVPVVEWGDHVDVIPKVGLYIQEC